MKRIVEKVFRVRNGGMIFFAEVDLEVRDRSAESELFQLNSVVFRLNGRGFASQGYLEDAPTEGYEDWKAGAKAGVLFALQEMNARGAEVAVYRITGRYAIDTNAWIVAEAAAKAIWRNYDYLPAPELLAQIENLVDQSWNFEDERPDFSQFATIQ